MKAPVFIQKHSKLLLLLWGISAITFLSVGIGYLIGYTHTPETSITQVQPSLAISPSPTQRPVMPPAQIAAPIPDDWASYSDLSLKVTISYPKQFKMDFVQTQPYLNRVITWYTSGQLVSDQNDPHVVLHTDQTVPIPILNTRRFEGEVHDGFQYQKIWYQFPNRHAKGDQDRFIIVELSALPAQLEPNEILKIDTKAVHALNPEDVILFDEIVSHIEVN